MRGRVGVVIPAWFSADTDPAEAERLLLTTLADSDSCVSPADIVVVADGSPPAAEAARSLYGKLGETWGEPFQLIELPENRGKGGAIVEGIRRLLERPGLGWIAVRDADGDHLIDDLPHLYRVGEQVAAECPGALACVIGRRASVYAPLGWFRGEFELLLNEVIVDAVAFARARGGAAWDSRYLAGRVPDLQSGYKLYSLAAAHEAAEALVREAAAEPDVQPLRTGMEIVPFVTLALAGGVFAEAERKTYQDQPVTSYGTVDPARFYGSKLAWALKRCAVPPGAAAVLTDSAIAHRPLYTDPQGRAHLLRMRQFVLERLDTEDPPADPASEPRMRRFL